nr:hypothetical protein [Tanacetum cinerariifolium]
MTASFGWSRPKVCSRDLLQRSALELEEIYLIMSPQSSIMCLSYVMLDLNVCCSGMLNECDIEYVDTMSFSFGGSELVRGASLSNGCSIYLKSFPYQRNLDSRVTVDSPIEGFTPNDLLKLYCRCLVCNIVDIVFVCSGLNGSWYNLLANHTAILPTEDTFLHDLTPDEVIVSNVDPTVIGKRANDVEGSADNVDDVDDQDDAHYHSTDNSSDPVRSFDIIQCFDLVWSFDFVQSFDPVRSFDRRTRKGVDLSSSFRMCYPPIQTVVTIFPPWVMRPRKINAPSSPVTYYMPHPYADGESVVPLKYTKEEWDQILVPSA